MIGGIQNRPIYSYQKDTSSHVFAYFWQGAQSSQSPAPAPQNGT